MIAEGAKLVLPVEELKRLRTALNAIPAVEAHLVVGAARDLLFGLARPSKDQLRNAAVGLLTEEEHARLEVAMGSAAWLTAYQSALDSHEAAARAQLFIEWLRSHLKPAGYLPDEWFGGGRLPRMLGLIGEIVKAVQTEDPRVGAALLAHLLGDDTQRSLNGRYGVACPKCTAASTRAGGRAQALGVLELRGSGPVVIYVPPTPPSPEMLQLKYEVGLPPPQGSAAQQLWVLTDEADTGRQFVCRRGHEVQMEREKLLAMAERRLPKSLPERFRGT